MTRRTWPSVGASSSEAKPAASEATSGPSATRSSTAAASAAGTATASAAPASTSADRRLVGAGRPQQRDGAAALARGDRERLDERVQAHEPDREPDAAQHGGEDAEERRRCSWSRRRPGVARRPARAGRAATRARSAPAVRRIAIAG